MNIFTFLAQKALFVHHLYTLKITQIEVKYTLHSVLVIKLSFKVPVVKLEWLVLELPAANQRVSNSVFSISSYTLGQVKFPNFLNTAPQIL